MTTKLDAAVWVLGTVSCTLCGDGDIQQPEALAIGNFAAICPDCQDFEIDERQDDAPGQPDPDAPEYAPEPAGHRFFHPETVPCCLACFVYPLAA